MQNQKDNHSFARRGAGSAALIGIFFSAIAFAACASSNEIPTGTSSSGRGGAGGGATSSSDSAGGAGGAGVGGGAGEGGGAMACQPGVVEDCYSGPQGTKDIGICKSGKRTCKPDGTGFGACEGEIVPGMETCTTAEDDDCDGVANDKGQGCICTPKAMEVCYSGPGGTAGIGICKEGMRTCNDLGSEWSACEGEVIPAKETCGDATDEDCNGSACAGSLWSLIFGGPNADQVGGVAVDSLGNIYVVGAFGGTMMIGNIPLTSAGGLDAYIAKFDPKGNPLWAQSFGDAADQVATAVAVDGTNSVVLTGYFNGVITFGNTTLTATSRDVFIAKLGDTGASLWSKKIGGGGNQTGIAVTTDSQSNILLAGSFDGQLVCAVGCISSKGGQDMFFYKFDPAGTQLWLRVIGDPSEQSPNAIAIDSGDNLVVGGQFQGGPLDFGAGNMLSSAGGNDAFVLKLDTAGMTTWAKRFGDPLDQEVRAVAVGPADGIAVTGTFKSSINLGALDNQSAGLTDIFIGKLGSDGAYEWDHSYGDASEQTAMGVLFDAAGGVLLTGGFQGNIDFGGGPLVSLVSYDQFLVALSDKGVYSWSVRFGDAASQIGRNIAKDPMSGDVIVSAAASGMVDYGFGPLTSAGGDDVTLVKLNP